MESENRTALVAFLVAAVFAGGNAVAIKFSNRELAPFWGAGLRFGVAALLMLAFVALRRRRLPVGRQLRGCIIYGLLTFYGAFGFIYLGLVHIPATTGGALLALVPLATLLLAVLQGQEKFGMRSLVGAVLSVAGVAVISEATLSANLPFIEILSILGAVVCFAQSGIVVRKYTPDPLMMNAVGMTVGAVCLFATALVMGEPAVLPVLTETWASVLYMAIPGSIVAFTLSVVVLKYWEASRAAYIAVLIPFVTTLLAVLILDEELTASLLIGGVLIIGGVWIGALAVTGHAPVAGPVEAGLATPPD